MPFGRFLELAVATDDILASAQFYQRLRFGPLITGDAWPHRYGVFSDGRLHIGLHARAEPRFAVSFVKPELARSQAQLHSAGFEAEAAHFGDEELHHVLLRDPGGHAILLLEARTYSPAPSPPQPSLCGYFAHLGLPQRDFEAANAYWERGGFVALPQQGEPYAHLPLTSDTLTLAFHPRRVLDAPLLVFECEQLGRCREQLRSLDIPISIELPQGLWKEQAALIEAPEGTLLLLLQTAE